MQSHLRFVLAIAVLVSLTNDCPLNAAGRIERGVAATVQPLATEAAMKAFERGGNAIDAAVAAALTLGVVDGHNSGIGGGCFMLIRRADGSVIAIDGREMAPAAATRDMYLRKGKAVPELSQTGALASAVPGALAAYDHAISKYGKLKLADLLRPAADVAEKGFAIDQNYARKLVAHASQLKGFPSSSAVFLHPDGSVYKAGAKLQQTDLAHTYRSIAEQGVGWFYRGPFAESTAAWMKENGGLITAEDFANYQIKLREPLKTTYRGYEVLGFPPPSSGGVHVAQLLNMLEERDLVAMGAKSADFVHVIAESMKLVFADRAYWLGDPDFAAVPRRLIDKGYASSLNKKVSLSTAGTVESHGTPERAHDDIFGKHTTHVSTADAEGNWVALTATINTGFGSKVVVPGTGVVLNNQMDDFSLQSGVANSFGLLGAEANAIAPGKRPLSSMSPTIVLKDGKPILSTGAAGGPTIISQTVLTLIYSLDFGMAPKQALAQPRIHHQWSPDTLKLEDKFGQEVRDTLRVRGHHLQLMNYFGACQAVALDSKGRFQGAADPRVEGKAQVFSE